MIASLPWMVVGSILNSAVTGNKLFGFEVIASLPEIKDCLAEKLFYDKIGIS